MERRGKGRWEEKVGRADGEAEEKVGRKAIISGHGEQ